MPPVERPADRAASTGLAPVPGLHVPSSDRAPDSDLLRSFLAVAECGNVTLAARRIARTQSGVSIQIRRLEDQLGVQLFVRQPRGMKLTESGKTLVPAAKRAMGELDKVGELFANPLTGRIRIGLPDNYSGLVFEQVLHAFNVCHRDVEIRAVCSCSHTFPELVDRGELDIAVYAAPPHESVDAFFEEPMCWVSHELFTIEEHGEVPLAMLERSCYWSQIPVKTLDHHGRPWRLLYGSESYDGVKAAINARLAVGVLPFSALDANMVARTDLPPLPPVSLAMLRHDGEQPLMDAMEQAILNAFGTAR